MPDVEHLFVAIDDERERRLAAKAEGIPYRYTSDATVWCDYCAGFFGGAHQWHQRLCTRSGRKPRQCPCLDCVVVERLAAERL